MNRFVDEFLHHVPAAEPLRDVLIEILSDLESKDVAVSTRYNEMSSLVESSPDGGTRIRINPRSGTAQQPLNPLWDLIHEWGHVLEGTAGGDPHRRGKVEHENSIWLLAWTELLKRYPALVEYESAYHEHRRACVATYRHHRPPTGAPC
jgi:hypothetical protein